MGGCTPADPSPLVHICDWPALQPTKRDPVNTSASASDSASASNSVPVVDPAVLEPQPTDPAQVAGWLDRLHVAARAALPGRFTVHVDWNDTTTGEPLTLTFVRAGASWDPDEVQYRLAEAITVPHLDGTGEAPFAPDTLHFTGRWLNRRHIRRPLADPELTHDFGNRVVDAAYRNPTAAQSVALAELIRCIRLRQRVGDNEISHDGHTHDIEDLQNALAAHT